MCRCHYCGGASLGYDNACPVCEGSGTNVVQYYWKPTLQTKFGSEEGNCLAACIATMFPVDIDDVPDFSGDDWMIEFSDWAKEHLEMIVMMVKASSELWATFLHLLQGQRVMTTIDNGPCRHAVITQGSRIVWDPNSKVWSGGNRELIEKDNPTFYIFSPLNVR